MTTRTTKIITCDQCKTRIVSNDIPEAWKDWGGIHSCSDCLDGPLRIEIVVRVINPHTPQDKILDMLQKAIDHMRQWDNLRCPHEEKYDNAWETPNLIGVYVSVNQK